MLQAPIRAPPESPTVPRIAPVEVSWARAAVANDNEIKRQKERRPALDMNSHPHLNRIVDESRLEKGTPSYSTADRAPSVTGELSLESCPASGIVDCAIVILSGIGPFPPRWAAGVLHVSHET